MPRKTIPASTHPMRIRGFTLTEILVAIVILALGMLGLASLHLTSLRGNLSAYIHSHVTMIVNDLVERVRSNPPRSDPAYDSSEDSIAGMTDNSVRTLYSNFYCKPDGGSTLGGSQRGVCQVCDTLEFTNTFNTPFTCASPENIVDCGTAPTQGTATAEEYRYCSDLTSTADADESKCDDPVDVALHDLWELYCGRPNAASTDYVGGASNLFSAPYLAIHDCVVNANNVCISYQATLTWYENMGVAESIEVDDPDTTTVNVDQGRRLRAVTISFQP